MSRNYEQWLERPFADVSLDDELAALDPAEPDYGLKYAHLRADIIRRDRSRDTTTKYRGRAIVNWDGRR